MSASVKAVNWDITLGVATTGLGQLILSKTSDSEDVVPEAVDHTGLIVFGCLYEYGDLGILKTELDEETEPKSKYPAVSLRSVEPLGETSKTQEEFEQWVEEQNAGDFQGSNYDLVNRSCVVWAIRGAEFLGVQYPENWDKIVAWAARNKNFSSVVGQSGLAARYIQHKATEYVQNPEKFKEKAKKLYRKLRRKKRAAAVSDEAVGPDAVIDDEDEELTDGEEDDDEDDSDGDHVEGEVPAEVTQNNEISTIME